MTLLILPILPILPILLILHQAWRLILMGGAPDMATIVGTVGAATATAEVTEE